LIVPTLQVYFENMVEPCSLSNKSYNLWMGCLYLIVMFLMALQSMHIILHVPSFLGIRITDMTTKLILCCTTLFPTTLSLIFRSLWPLRD